MSERKSVLLLWDRIGDYHRARIRACVQSNKFSKVVCADIGQGDELYQWESSNQEFNYHRLSTRKVEGFDLFRRFLGYKKILKQEQIRTVAIPGYGRIEYVVFIIWAKLSGIRVILFAESWYQGKLDFLKRLILPLMVDRFFVSGMKAETHFHQNLKLPLSKILKGYSVVDNTHFSRKKTVISEKTQAKPILLTIARFSEEKNLASLIHSFKKSVMRGSWTLKIIGGGPLKNKLKELTHENDGIELLDWVEYDELPNHYHNAQVFILPSIFEPWGLVVNEAMAAGLPVICSIQCGCVNDLVFEKNGLTFDANSEGQMVEVLNKISLIPKEIAFKMGNASNVVIEKFRVEEWANKLYLMSID